MNNPVIIVGMHRSGTSLLTRILDDLGMFVGDKISSNHEAKFFQELNIWLFNELGGRWDCPPNMNYLLENDKLLELVTQYLTQTIESLDFIKYLGWKRYFFRNNFCKNSESVWGWKDPRNVYTLPVWLKLFPEAKVIYIERHGVDVANSLKSRSLKELKEKNEAVEKRKRLSIFGSKEFGLSSASIRCCTLEGGFSLWEEYTHESQKRIKQIGSQKVFSLQYENLLEAPTEVIGQIADFLGLKVNRRVEDLSVTLQASRAYAYKYDPELQEFASKVRDRLVNYEA